MKMLKINLDELARDIVDKFPIFIENFNIKIIDVDHVSLFEHVDAYVLARTPDKYLIVEPALQTLLDELWPFIIKEVHRRMFFQMNKLDAEDLELLESDIREYELEVD